MSITKGIVSLLMVIGVFVVMLDQVMPKAVATPARAMETAISATDRKASLNRGSASTERDTPINYDNDIKMRVENNVSAIPNPAGAGSQLVTLITGKGMACARVTGVLPVRTGDGIYSITCEVGSGYRRYIVDTRQGGVETG